jgi:hypothetical protein
MFTVLSKVQFWTPKGTKVLEFRVHVRFVPNILCAKLEANRNDIYQKVKNDLLLTDDANELQSIASSFIDALGFSFTFAN